MIEAKPGTCEEASPFAPPGCYLPCGKDAVKRVHHPRDQRTYNMCEACADHNIKNRGAVDHGAMSAIEKWPGLKKAALDIAYDNGMINRCCPEDDWLRSLDPVLGADGVYDADLERWSEWLLTLSEDELSVVAAGEETEMLAIMANAPPCDSGEGDLNGLLNDIFEAPEPECYRANLKEFLGQATDD